MSTDDSPDREFVVYDREGFPIATQKDAVEGPSNVSEIEDMSNPSNSTENPKPYPTPRREVWWLDLGGKNQSLESIKWRFEDYLNRFLSSTSSNSLLRHITSPMDNKLRHNIHQCPGYLREEITLASDVSKSVIVSHAFPSQSEVCSICGQLVQYDCADSEPSIVDISDEEGEANSSNGSHHLPQLEPSGIPSPDLLIVGPPSPVPSDISDSGSIFIPPSPPLSDHGHPLMTTLQSINNRPVEKVGLFSPGVLNPDTVTRHSRESLDTYTDSLADEDFIAWGPPTLSGRSVHFVSDTQESSGLSSKEPLNPSRFRPQRKSSDIDSSSGWIPRDLSSHSGPSGLSHKNKPEENRFRKGSNAASSNNVIRTDDLDNYSHNKIPDGSRGIPRDLTTSSHSGLSGPSHSNKPGKNIFRRSSNAASSNNVIKTNDLDNLSHTKTPKKSPGRRRTLTGISSFFGLGRDR